MHQATRFLSWKVEGWKDCAGGVGLFACGSWAGVELGAIRNDRQRVSRPTVAEGEGRGLRRLDGEVRESIAEWFFGLRRGGGGSRSVELSIF